MINVAVKKKSFEYLLPENVSWVRKVDIPFHYFRVRIRQWPWQYRTTERYVSQSEASAGICLKRKSVFEKASLYGNMQRIKCIKITRPFNLNPVLIITNSCLHFRLIKLNMAYLQNAPTGD